MILEDWFKNDPINQIAGLEKQINDLCDENSVKSCMEEALGETEESESQQDKVSDPPIEDTTTNNHQDKEEEVEKIDCNEYSLPKDNLTKVWSITL